ncbi:NADP-dependent oxidoreductase [Acinetobacter stercoris]|uniref:Quinone oxidoreductase 1 n=1 Tax=Acinetobacter stercoris TaxID=2126983 RepID=A0A2U3N4P0_9GAMM|nr:NADP-dependent oxidoreductase [Acinetobacter stercoris]SPL72646.1 Quinone oxidoreductase 1 [Acinetobacter stercoris]
MKAVIFNQYGGPEVLETIEIPTPTPNENQLLVEVKAFGVNPLDWKLRQGFMKNFMPLNFPHILGAEVAGIVVEAPDNNEFKAGDRVYGRAVQSYAEYALMEIVNAQIIPDFLSFNEAAALPSSTQTAYTALKLIGNLEQGQNVLIHAGAGGVGVAAIQIAKSIGANITTTSSKKNFDLLKSLGADHIIDYHENKLSDLGQEFDLIIDSIGGETQINSWHILKEKGTLVSLVSDEHGLSQVADNGKKFVFMRGSQPGLAAEINSLVLQKKIKPVIDSVFPFSKIREAHIKVQTGHSSGKVITEV